MTDTPMHAFLSVSFDESLTDPMWVAKCACGWKSVSCATVDKAKYLYIDHRFDALEHVLLAAHERTKRKVAKVAVKENC